MSPEERWELVLRTAPNDIRRLLRECHERLSTVDLFMGARLPDYSPLAETLVEEAWRSFGRPRIDDPPKPYDQPPDAPRPGDPRPQPNETEGFADYEPIEGT